MGTCPHCRAVTLPGDAVCYTCGRFLQGEGASYSMPNAPKKRGVVVDSKCLKSHWSGPYHAHIAFNYINQLWQFIDF